jgi:hypothetical protein
MLDMLDKIKNAFVRMGRAGLYARMDFGENAASATPALVGKALRLIREGQPYFGIAVFSQADKAEYVRTGNLMIHFAPLPAAEEDEEMPAGELVRRAREVGTAVQHCLAQEGLQVEWSGLAEETILVTGLCPVGV